MSHNDYKEMIPVRALSALDPSEDRDLSEHLSTCAECRQELDDWQATAASLSLEAEPMEPSPKVREKILSQVRDTKGDASKVLPFAPPQRNVWSSFGSLGAIAAVILFAGLLVYVVLLWQENKAVRSELAGLRTETQKIQLELAEKNRLVRMFAQPGTRFSELKAMPIAPGATAKLAYDSSGHAMIMAQNLPAAPVGKEYQLWFIVPGKQPMPGKTFSTDNQGKGMMEDQVPAEAMNSAVFAITLERQGGVQAPEGAMYLKS
jgi:anti-sigma-K factor RskA